MCGRFALEIPKVSQQYGGYDCGLFALAFAFELAQGRNPSAFTFKQFEMREHFRMLVQTVKFSPFPRETTELAITEAPVKQFNMNKQITKQTKIPKITKNTKITKNSKILKK